MARSALRFGSWVISLPVSVSSAMQRWIAIFLSPQNSVKSRIVKNRILRVLYHSYLSRPADLGALPFSASYVRSVW